MSIGLATSRTAFVELRSPVDSDAEARTSPLSPIAEVNSADTSEGKNFLLDLSEPSIRAINEIVHVRRRPKGAFMFFEGDAAHGVYILYEGRANVLTANTEGKTLILKTALPGDVLGLNSVLAGNRFPHKSDCRNFRSEKLTTWTLHKGVQGNPGASSRFH